MIIHSQLCLDVYLTQSSERSITLRTFKAKTNHFFKKETSNHETVKNANFTKKMISTTINYQSTTQYLKIVKLSWRKFLHKLTILWLLWSLVYNVTNFNCVKYLLFNRKGDACFFAPLTVKLHHKVPRLILIRYILYQNIFFNALRYVLNKLIKSGGKISN